MSTINAGQSQDFFLSATDGLFVTCTGVAKISYENEILASAGSVSASDGEVRIGYFGVPMGLTISALSGTCTVNTSPSVIEPLTARQAGDNNDSSPLDVKLAVNQLAQKINFDALAFQISSVVPTVTVSAAGAASSIPSSVRIQPMKKVGDATKFQIDGDPNFRISSLPSSKSLLDSADIIRADFLTGGSPQAARWRPYVEFTHTGQQFELYFRATGTSTKYRIWVNGKPLTATMQTVAGAAGNRFRILVDFGAVGVRDIRFEMVEFSFGGVFVEPFGSITATNYKRKKFAVMSDSTGAGANGVSAFEAWPWLTANYLGMDCINLSIGGSGYIASPAYITRLQDVIDANPDYLLVAGGQNDKAGNTTQAIVDAFNAFCDAVNANVPNCKIIVGGVHMTTQNADTTGAPLESALIVESSARRLPFISERDPEGILQQLSAWANGVAYKFGDMINQNSLPFICHTEHTSSGSFDATKFRCAALFSGTGRVGTAAGNGNFDICMSNDGVHFSIDGMSIQGISYAQQIQKSL